MVKPYGQEVFMLRIFYFALVFCAVVVSGCNGGTSSEESGDAQASQFPSGLTIASPVDIEPAEMVEQTHSSSLRPMALDSDYVYSKTVAEIESVFNGSATFASKFDGNLFYNFSSSADCFGPRLMYENHPDGPIPPNGELPTGDLGIWLETEDGTTEACAAAQLNKRLEGVKDRSKIALISLAALVGVYKLAGNTFPDDVSAGSTVDLSTEFNAFGITNVTFNTASIALNAGGDIWSYTIELVYTPGVTPLTIYLNLDHAPGASTYIYEGLLNYRVDYVSGYGGNCTGTNITQNGSIHYIRDSQTSVTLQSREAQFCGHGTNGITEDVTSSKLTSGKIVSRDNDDTAGAGTSWRNDFNIFTAQYDPTSLIGTYSYIWQAGWGDSNSRILDIGLGTATAGEAYFGYGDPVDDDGTTTDGSIKGFYCNWAGPGARTFQTDYAQRQHMTLNSSLNVFEPTNAGASDITYAPVDSCIYSGGSFRYDRDIDSDLADETLATAVVDTGAALEFDLMTLSAGETTIWEHITDSRGYSLPVYTY